MDIVYFLSLNISLSCQSSQAEVCSQAGRLAGQSAISKGAALQHPHRMSRAGMVAVSEDSHHPAATASSSLKEVYEGLLGGTI